MLPWYMRNLGGGKRVEGVVTPAARSSFYFAFGITPDEQIALEEFYDDQKVDLSYGEWHPRAIFPSEV
jgi:hypothetical protein